MGAALAAAVEDAAAQGELAVPAGVPVDVRCTGAGVYESPVALRLRVDPWVLARRVRGDVTSRGFVRVRCPAGALVPLVDESYGVAEVVKRVYWADRPRTFDNPGFVVRFAYARAAWVVRVAGELGVENGPPEGYAGDELVLLRLLGEMPGWAAGEARGFVSFLERLGHAYHDVHERYPALPKGDEKPGAVHGARVALARAARIAIGNGLTMIGETPRERI